MLYLFDEAISLFNVAAECLVLRGGSLLGVRGRAQVLPERLPASGRGLLLRWRRAGTKNGFSATEFIQYTAVDMISEETIWCFHALILFSPECDPKLSENL